MKGFQFYQDHKNEWRWRLKNASDVIVADSAEGYYNKSDCEKGAALFTTLGPDAPVVKRTVAVANGEGPEWKYFEDVAQKWRWHFQAANNRIIAASPKGYEDESAVKAMISEVKALLKEIGKEKSGSGYASPVTGGAASGGRFA
ncbi:MAG: YegP family protein [Bacteroidetes bacterium]|nr:YegP family protein [Bacteroidota bacterium]